MTAAQRRKHTRRRAERAAKAARAAAHQQLLAARAASTRKRTRRRNAEAFAVTGATEFSCDSVLSDPVQVIEMFKTFAPRACLQLITATKVTREPGQAGAPRIDGSWALVFLAHVMTGIPDWQRWYINHQTSRIWDLCGFAKRPSWATTYLRFRELEHPRYVAAFERAAAQFVRVAAHHVPHAFDFTHTDGSPTHSHVLLDHACPSKTYCQTRTGRVPNQIARAGEESINDERHERSAQAEPENPDAPPDTNVHKLTDEEARALGLADWRHSHYYRFGERGHILRCRDKQAGVRMYKAGPRSKRKVWVGGYFLPIVSDFFWAPFAVNFFAADIQEHLGWPETYRKGMAALNDDPENPTHQIVGVVADRAFTNKTFIAHNTENGVASITPERGLPGGKEWKTLRDPEGRWDEHGPRCRYCGGPPSPAAGPGEGFAITGSGDPRLTFRCALGWHEECRTKLQTISCRREYRALLPIGRQERIFHDMLGAHSHCEGIFDSWRDRYAVAGTSNATRSKRRDGIAAQTLRGAVALLAEWFRICVRQGYIGNHSRRNTSKPVKRDGGAKRLIALRTYREREHLILPIGPMVDKLPFRKKTATPAAGNAPPGGPPPAGP
ncbi:MAG: hypothetical protein ACLP01_28470 [Solirubrobacteraceae bacterium]